MSDSMVRVYYDAEFTGLHKDTTLVSIGLISESGGSFYAEFTDYDEKQVKADKWLQRHVINNLMYKNKESEWSEQSGIPMGFTTKILCEMKGSKAMIKKELQRWLHSETITPFGSERKLLFHTDCYAYDWVLLMDLLDNKNNDIYYIPIDLCTMMYTFGVDPDISREEFVSNLMEDPNKYNLLLNKWKTADPKAIDSIKHNSLWDAWVAKLCFEKLVTEYHNSALS